MLKFLLTFFSFAILLWACEPKGEKTSGLDHVISIQEDARTQPSDSTFDYLKKAQSILNIIEDAPDSLKAENHYLTGLYFKSKGKMDSAAVYFHNATDYVVDSIYHKRQVLYFRSAWDTYAGLGLYGDCLTISNKYKSLLDEEKHYSAFTWAYHREYMAYIMMRDYDQAKVILDHQMEFTKRRDTANIPYVAITQALLLYKNLGKKPEALNILEELLAKEDQLTIKFQQQANMNYGVLQYYEGDYSKALTYYLKALAASKKNTGSSDHLDYLVNDYSNIAEVLMNLKKYPEARKYLDSAKAIGFQNIAGNRRKAILSYELRWAMETDKNTSRLTRLLDDMYQDQEEAYAQKTKNELLALTKANEKEKVLLREKQLTELENLKLENRSILLGVSVLLLGTIGLLFYQRRKLKFERKNLQNQQRLLRSQMNPHFTFNTLYAINNEIKKDQKGASDYLVKFSRLLRLVLENSTQNYVQLEKELEALRKYMDLQLVGTPNKFQYKIELINLDEDELIFIPPMLLQPFVENSIEHGFAGLAYTGNIFIRLERKGKFINCLIEDNGCGITEEKNALKNSTSVQLISDFIKKATKSEIQIENLADTNSNKTGVAIYFAIPYRYTEDD
ncbi:MAG: histidine kinase [Bacteroidota bacterium]